MMRVPDSGDLNQEPRNTFLLTFTKITKYNYIKAWAKLSLLKKQEQILPKIKSYSNYDS